MSYTVVDLYSGCGGMSYGFHAHPCFRVVGAVDAERGKPSSRSSSQCNATYAANMGVVPLGIDLADVGATQRRQMFAAQLHGKGCDVLLACPPCTGFSRANPNNHLADDSRNSLVVAVAAWVQALRPRLLIMENARELIMGNFSCHFLALREALQQQGYHVAAEVHLLSEFGLAQRRERAIVLASRGQRKPITLKKFWSGLRVRSSATYVRRAIGNLPKVQHGEVHAHDEAHRAPTLRHPQSLARIQAIPRDGGSWRDLLRSKRSKTFLTPAMLASVAKKRLGSHPDVYGRLWWDRPAVTIKRECGHNGNGRYTHPEQDRLITVREAALLQGFPLDYIFKASALSNMYRHVGDAVPPLVSYQLAHLAWYHLGSGPAIMSAAAILPRTSLRAADLLPIDR